MHREGPLLVLAGPGSGKTRVITHRIAHLLSQRRAAVADPGPHLHQQGGRRNAAPRGRAGPGDASLAEHVSPLRRRLLRQYADFVGLAPNFTIYDTSDARQTIKRVIEAHQHQDAAFHARPARRGDLRREEQAGHRRPIRAPAGQHAQPRRGRSLPARTRSGCWPRRPSTSTTCCSTWPSCSTTIRRFAPSSTSGSATCWSTSTRTRTAPST